MQPVAELRLTLTPDGNVAIQFKGPSPAVALAMLGAVRAAIEQQVLAAAKGPVVQVAPAGFDPRANN